MKNIWSISAVLLGMSLQAIAQTPSTGTLADSPLPIITKDWSLEDLGQVCLASTTRNIAGQSYRLEMQVDKSMMYPVEIFVREIPAQATTRSAQFMYDSSRKISYIFSPILDSAGVVSLYQIPRGTQALVSYIKRGNSLTVEVSADGLPAKKVDFSLRGSSLTVDLLQSRCNGKAPLVSDEFEKSFFDQAKLLALDPAKLRPDQVARLRSAYLAGHAAYALRKGKEKELQALTAKYSKQIQELAKVTGTLDQLTQKELAGLNARKAGIEAKIVAIQQSIDSKQTEIQAKDQELLAANANYDAAWQELAPHKPEHDRLRSSLDSAQGALGSAQEYLAGIDSGINSENRTIEALTNEAEGKRRQLSLIENSLWSARREFQDADSDVRRFDERREVRDRLAGNGVYINERNKADAFARQIPQFEAQVRNLSALRVQRRQQYQQCMAVKGANCRAQLAAVQQADTQFQQASVNLQRARVNLQTSRNSIAAIERQVESDVRHEKSRLIARAERAHRQVGALERDRESLDRRIRDITSFEIPSHQNRLNSLRAERPDAVALVGKWRGEVSSRRSALDAFKQSVGYDAKKLAVDQTAAEVMRLKREVAKLESEKAASVKELANQQKNLEVTLKGIDDVLNKIRVTEGKSSELQLALKPYYEAKAILDAEINQRAQQFEAAKLAYNSELSA